MCHLLFVGLLVLEKKVNCVYVRLVVVVTMIGTSYLARKKMLLEFTAVSLDLAATVCDYCGCIHT